MAKKASNPCTRCGKERIVVSTSYEKTQGTTLTIRVTECPDPDCQKKVDEKLSNEKRRREELNYAKEDRLNKRKGLHFAKAPVQSS